jgi:hypothetical protein
MGIGALREYFRIYVELREDDKDALRSLSEPELKTRWVVERAGILDRLPDGINDDWVLYGRAMSRDSEPSWERGSRPVWGDNGRRVWIMDDA